jgi:putative protein-disulfide isomerase
MHIIYAFDPLCGWCYGLIPALRHFTENEPDVAIEVLPGGLFTGTPARPYASLIPHIRRAEQNLDKVTGRKPSEKFHALISQKKTIDASSERPSHAILQMKTLAPQGVLDFAHKLQEMHYEDGRDLNLPETYNGATDALGLPRLDTQAIVAATLSTPMIAEAYTRCANLRPHGYPTIFIVDDKTVIGTIPSTYEPEAFLQAFYKIRDSHPL